MIERSPAPIPTDPAEETGADRVLALDNVPLDLPIAGAGTRSLAAFIDYLVVAALGTVFVAAALFVGLSAGLTSLWWVAALLLALFALEYGYFALSEILMEGRTLGKRGVGLRVVTAQGSRPGSAALLARNVVRNLDLVIGVPMMVLDPLARRLGDRLGGTLVIRTHRAATMVLRRVPRGWNGRQIELLEGFLERCPELEPAHAERIAASLVAVIERDDPDFLVAAVGLSPVLRLQASAFDDTAAR